MSDWIKAWELIDEQRQVINQLAEALRLSKYHTDFRIKGAADMKYHCTTLELDKAIDQALALAKPYLQKKEKNIDDLV